MKDTSKVYIVTAAKSAAPLGVSGSLVNLFQNLGVRETDPKPFYQQFKQDQNGNFLNKPVLPLKIGDKTFKVHCQVLKAPIEI